MNIEKILKRSTGLFLALAFALSISAFAGEIPRDLQIAPAQVDNVTVTTQPPLQTMPTVTPMNTAND